MPQLGNPYNAWGLFTLTGWGLFQPNDLGPAPLRKDTRHAGVKRQSRLTRGVV